MAHDDTDKLEWIDFAKLHGLGNDFIFIDDLSSEVNLTDDEVRALCDRHFGIGADGVILVRPSEDADCVAYMHYINADGTLAQMCGNGVRCFAKYLVDRGFVNESEASLVADTLAGPKRITFERDDSGRLASATVDMGNPILMPESIPTNLDANATFEDMPCVLDELIDSPWGTFAFTCVSMGNPHAICFLDDLDALDPSLFVDKATRSLDSLDLDRIGAFFESHDAFPEKANIEFAHIDADGIHMRVYERGCGETLACGTGACATDVAAALTGRAGKHNKILLRGGALDIDWAEDGHVLMTGPAIESFTGTWIR